MQPPSNRRPLAHSLGTLACILLAIFAYLILRGYQGAQSRQGRDHARLPDIVIADLDLRLLHVQDGSFQMGSLDKKASKAEQPLTTVHLSKFYLGATEVTRIQYNKIMGLQPPSPQNGQLPIVDITWDEAVQFCQRLTKRARDSGQILANQHYTLPTEAQWEYACRAGSTGNYAGALGELGWYGRNSGGILHPVATKKPNNWGFYDMHGNAWEWCLDGMSSYPGGMVDNPQGPSQGEYHVTRGGGWDAESLHCRASARNFNWHYSKFRSLGFRVALVQGHDETHS